MKTWYQAVCDVHKEFIDVFVSNPTCTSTYLSDYDIDIQRWLEKHCGCNGNQGLRFIGYDLQMDYCFENGYKKVILYDNKECERWK